MKIHELIAFLKEIEDQEMEACALYYDDWGSRKISLNKDNYEIKYYIDKITENGRYHTYEEARKNLNRLKKTMNCYKDSKIIKHFIWYYKEDYFPDENLYK